MFEQTGLSRPQLIVLVTSAAVLASPVAINRAASRSSRGLSLARPPPLSLGVSKGIELRALFTLDLDIPNCWAISRLERPCARWLVMVARVPAGIGRILVGGSERQWWWQ